jgi:L-Ala-D/L-Glu epimerase
MQLRFRRVDWEFASTFRIAYRTQTHTETVQVELREAQRMGRGEAAGVSYHGETIELLLDQLASMGSELRNDISRTELQAMLPPGGARNAIDCALWDLEAKRTGCSVWQLAGIPPVPTLVTAFTLGLDTIEATASAARAAARCSVLKLKLSGTQDLQRVAAVRDLRPDAELIVDANQAWSIEQLHELASPLAQLGVRLIEQPLPVGSEAALQGYEGPIPLCADESFQTSESLQLVIGRYPCVNIKLDKTGGLTEALRAARSAREHGMRLMVGCMGGSSLAMAPAFVVGRLCEWADLDGPLLQKSDVETAIRYEGSRMHAPSRELWG